MSVRKVKVTDVDFNKIVVYPPTDMTNGGKDGGKGNAYKICKIAYNYGTTDRPLIDAFIVSHTDMVSNRGVVRAEVKENGVTKYIYSISCLLDPVRHAQELRYYEMLYDYILTQLEKYKGKLGYPQFSKEMLKGMYQNPIYRPVDEQSGEFIGTNKYHVFKLGKYDSNQTVFKLANGVDIPKEKFMGNTLTMTIDTKLTHEYIGGGKIYDQEHMTSVIVTHMSKPSGGFTQDEELKSYSQDESLMEEARRIMGELSGTDGKSEGMGDVGNIGFLDSSAMPKPSDTSINTTSLDELLKQARQ